MPHPCFVRALTLVLVLPGLSIPAEAGGRMAMPPVRQALASPAACAAEIEARASADRRAVVARRVAADGATREVTLQTQGIERHGPESLRYEATLWYHHGRVRAELGQIETSHSFEKTVLECEGAMLTTSGEKGFTLSTFEKTP